MCVRACVCACVRTCVPMFTFIWCLGSGVILGVLIRDLCPLYFIRADGLIMSILFISYSIITINTLYEACYNLSPFIFQDSCGLALSLSL